MKFEASFGSVWDRGSFEHLFCSFGLAFWVNSFGADVWGKLWDSCVGKPGISKQARKKRAEEITSLQKAGLPVQKHMFLLGRDSELWCCGHTELFIVNPNDPYVMTNGVCHCRLWSCVWGDPSSRRARQAQERKVRTVNVSLY